MQMALSHLVRRTSSLPRVVFLTLCIFLATPEIAAATQPSQADVEEVYLFDFGKFVRWPTGADQGPLHFCVVGSPAFAAGLQKTVASENIDGRPLDVRLVLRVDQEAACAILFIDSTQRAHVDEMLQAVADKPTLTVSDLPDFLSRGGMIQFRLVAKRVRFSVNLDAVNRGHLSMSSELLKVAMSVTGRGPEGGAP